MGTVQGIAADIEVGEVYCLEAVYQDFKKKQIFSQTLQFLVNNIDLLRTKKPSELVQLSERIDRLLGKKEAAGFLAKIRDLFQNDQAIFEQQIRKLLGNDEAQQQIPAVANKPEAWQVDVKSTAGSEKCKICLREFELFGSLDLHNKSETGKCKTFVATNKDRRSFAVFNMQERQNRKRHFVLRIIHVHVENAFLETDEDRFRCYLSLWYTIRQWMNQQKRLGAGKIVGVKFAWDVDETTLFSLKDRFQVEIE